MTVKDLINNGFFTQSCCLDFKYISGFKEIQELTNKQMHRFAEPFHGDPHLSLAYMTELELVLDVDKALSQRLTNPLLNQTIKFSDHMWVNTGNTESHEDVGQYREHRVT